VSAGASEIDWQEAERRERRRDVLLAPGIVAFFVGIVLLTGGFAFWTGGVAWAVVGVFLVSLVFVSASSHLVPRLHTRTSAGYRIQVALRQHVDPGPDLRARTDRQARYLAGISWAGWLVVPGLLGLLLGGQWDRRPVAAAVGAVLIIGSAVVYLQWWRARLAAARRWVSNPPGPPRVALPPTAAERWLAGRRGLAIVVGSALALGLILGLVLAFAARP
jgi:hypothetical protein